ncbi:hypothetical protein KEM55_001245 [Ascosphaera atra]|nr:hypothetical protein KEM55_001245 [Ascosphaera atra]
MPAPYQPYQPPPPPPQAYTQTRFIHHYAPSPHPQPADSNRSYSRRPSSSHSTMAYLPSPIQNRPSISPTQGNRDVGPLAGFPGSNNIPSNVSTTPTQYYSNPPSAQTGVPSSTRAQPSYTPLSLSGTGNGAPFPFSSPASTPARRPSSQAQTPQPQPHSREIHTITAMGGVKVDV